MKIFIDKDEPIASVVEKVINSADPRVTLVIPKYSALKQSLSNFQLLKREADSAGKEVVIESVDEEVLSFAKVSALEGSHPLFRSREPREHSFSDIVPAKKAEKKIPVQEEKKTEKKEIKEIKRTKEIEPPKPNIEIVEEVEDEKEEELLTSPYFPLRKENLPAETRDSFVRKPWFLKIAIGVLSAIVLGVLGGWLMAKFLGSLEVGIRFKKTDWTYEHAFLADKTVNKGDSEKNILPAELFTQSKNYNQPFPASGRANVSEKATGKVVIFNAYSSAPQSLVATTRFTTPDGKIFRLNEAVTVPGAQVKDGKIIPSSVEAVVTADKAGAEYNVGPIEKLAIPGFKGTPKYDGFYGSFQEPTLGGFIGEKAVPTDKDIAAAKEKVSETLIAALKNNVLNGLPQDFKFLEGASDITFPKMSVNKITDESGNFTVFAEARLRAIGFKEADLTAMLLEYANRDYSGQSFRSIELSYTKVVPDFTKGQLRFSVAGKGMLATSFDADAFKANIAGKKVSEVRTLVARLPGLESGKVSLWPSWLSKVPKNQNKIKIVVE